MCVHACVCMFLSVSVYMCMTVCVFVSSLKCQCECALFFVWVICPPFHSQVCARMWPCRCSVCLLT